MDMWAFVFFVLVYILALKLFYKTFFNPITIILIWWSSWLYIAFCDFTMLDKPSIEIIFLVFMMLTGLFIGGMLAAIRGAHYSLTNYEIKNDIFLMTTNKIFDNTFLFFLFVISFYFLKAMIYLLQNGFIGYRDIVFSSPGKPSVLFGSSYVELFYNLIISPFPFIFLFIGLVLFINYNEKKIFYWSAFMLILDSMMRLGRFGVYYIVVLSLLAILYSKTDHKSLKKKLLFILICLVALIIGIGSLRGSDFIDTFTNMLVTYHTVGFNLVSQEIMDIHSKINHSLTYGLGTLNGLISIFDIIIRRFYTELLPYDELIKNHQQFVIVGTDAHGTPLFYNAFYTLLFTFYSDGRELYIFGVSLFIGYLLGRSFIRYKFTGYSYDFVFLLSLMLVMIFSIFQSMFEGTRIWIVWLIFLLISRYINRMVKCRV